MADRLGPGVRDPLDIGRVLPGGHRPFGRGPNACHQQSRVVVRRLGEEAGEGCLSQVLHRNRMLPARRRRDRELLGGDVRRAALGE
ncbi:hypothetical protein [Streptomyces sp. CB03238]|uniref:hypothetical protein n=1 Tax=Streptomyces sp. CB03238 TaxID=1907777 RepID=UPI000A10F44E|nr:hypothetical protein [Streptomyces sp. CB03238]ORT57104.1 hypothetical protein BKD26_26220 [Streptomyces sp. CB03238]